MLDDITIGPAAIVSDGIIPAAMAPVPAEAATGANSSPTIARIGRRGRSKNLIIS